MRDGFVTRQFHKAGDVSSRRDNFFPHRKILAWGIAAPGLSNHMLAGRIHSERCLTDLAGGNRFRAPFGISADCFLPAAGEWAHT